MYFYSPTGWLEMNIPRPTLPQYEVTSDVQKIKFYNFVMIKKYRRIKLFLRMNVRKSFKIYEF